MWGNLTEPPRPTGFVHAERLDAFPKLARTLFDIEAAYRGLRGCDDKCDRLYRSAGSQNGMRDNALPAEGRLRRCPVILPGRTAGFACADVRARASGVAGGTSRKRSAAESA